jgi:2-keto-4-pentenoate hydratase
MTSDVIQTVARRLLQAHESRCPCEPVRGLMAPGDTVAAYAAQEINSQLWLGAGRPLVGRKIGLTNPAVQAQLGVDQPDYGMLFADMQVADGEVIPPTKVMQARVEAEVAFVMDDELNDEHLDADDVARAIRYALPAIEVVGSRIRDWDISITDTIADNASSGAFVLGDSPRSLAEFDPVACEMRMTRDGIVVSSGSGADCLGSPITSTLWLARVMARAGRALKPGDIVLSGALGPLVAAQPGDVFRAEISGLGTVTAAFADHRGRG